MPYKFIDDSVTTGQLYSATGKLWQDWYRILDAFRDADMDRNVAFLIDQHHLTPEWAQIIVTRFRREHA